MPVDPVTGWSLVKSIGGAAKSLYEVARGLKDYETKQRVDEVLDVLRELKQQASELEDENRDLRDKLRFKSDEFEFQNLAVHRHPPSPTDDGARWPAFVPPPPHACFLPFLPPRSHNRSPYRRKSLSGPKAPNMYCELPTSNRRNIRSPALLIPNWG